LGGGFLALFPACFIAALILLKLNQLFLPTLIGGVIWALAMGAFLWKTFDNFKNARFEFYDDRFVEFTKNKSTTMPYNRIGHILYKDKQTFLINLAYEETKKNSGTRIDVKPEEGEHYFNEIVRIVKRANPDRLFSYEREGKLEYSVDISRAIDLNRRTVQRLVSNWARASKFHVVEYDVVVDGLSEPAFTIVKLGRKTVSDLLLIRKDPNARPNKRSTGEVVLAITLPDISQSSLTWQNYIVRNGQAVVLGHCRVKERRIPPGRDFELEILGNTLTVKTGMFPLKSTILLNGTPVGEYIVPVLGWKTEIELDRPVSEIIGLSLILGLMRVSFTGGGTV
jgi:hypothetical protein